jgi:hypothetical protein
MSKAKLRAQFVNHRLQRVAHVNAQNPHGGGECVLDIFQQLEFENLGWWGPAHMFEGSNQPHILHDDRGDLLLENF